jgi:hypothetical protein
MRRDLKAALRAGRRAGWAQYRQEDRWRNQAPLEAGVALELAALSRHPNRLADGCRCGRQDMVPRQQAGEEDAEGRLRLA